MALELVPPPDDALGTDVVARAAVAVGLSLEPPRLSDGAWWRAGLAEAVERAPAVARPSPAYEAAPSPRSTRGATRA